MSGKQMDAIGRDKSITDDTDRWLLMGIASRANDDGTGHVGLEELAADWARCSTRTVKRRLTKLEARGCFTRTRIRLPLGWFGAWEFTLNQRPTPNTTCPLVDEPGANPEYAVSPDQGPSSYTPVAPDHGPTPNTPCPHIKRPSKRPSKRLSTSSGFRKVTERTKDADDLAAAWAIWDAKCRSLPKIRKLPTGTRARKLLAAYREADNPEHFGAAVYLVGSSDWYTDHRYGVETFCNHAAEWLDKAATPAPTADPEFRRMFGGGDDHQTIIDVTPEPEHPQESDVDGQLRERSIMRAALAKMPHVPEPVAVPDVPPVYDPDVIPY